MHDALDETSVLKKISILHFTSPCPRHGNAVTDMPPPVPDVASQPNSLFDFLLHGMCAGDGDEL